MKRIRSAPRLQLPPPPLPPTHLAFFRSRKCRQHFRQGMNLPLLNLSRCTFASFFSTAAHGAVVVKALPAPKVRRADGRIIPLRKRRLRGWALVDGGQVLWLDSALTRRRRPEYVAHGIRMQLTRKFIECPRHALHELDVRRGHPRVCMPRGRWLPVSRGQGRR